MQPAALTLAADPGLPDAGLRSDSLVIDVSTNAMHGFVLRLVADGAGTATGRSVAVHTPGLAILDGQGNEHRFDLSALAPPGLVLADVEGPVPDGQTLQYRVQLTAAVDFATAPETYHTQLRIDFEPRY